MQKDGYPKLLDSIQASGSSRNITLASTDKSMKPLESGEQGPHSGFAGGH